MEQRMDSYNDWQLIRELLLLAVFCLFVVWAILAGARQNRNAKRQIRRMTEQDDSVAVPKMTRGGDGRTVAYKGASREAIPVAGVARHAA